MYSRFFAFISFLLVVSVSTHAQMVDEDFNTSIAVSYNVKTIQKINTEYNEFGPVIVGNEIIFTSDRENDLVKMGENQWKKKKHLNLYKAAFTSPKDDSVAFSKAHDFDGKLPDYFHSGPIGFHPSGNFAILTRVVTKRKTNKPQLYVIKKENNQWSKPQLVTFCQNDFSYGHASFSADGSKVYFASDQIGTLGGKDIFVSSFNNGELSAPMNLGANVNTTSDEMFPFFQNNYLYFSSNKAGGTGGLDLYKSEWVDNAFQPAITLGSTINSSEDDFSFFLTATGKNGFFASNRKGNGGDDIYFFTVNETATIVSKNILGKFTYAKLQEGFPSGLQLQLLDEAGNVIQTTTTDANGQFKFVNLPANQEFTIKVVEMGEDLVLHIFNKDGKEYAVLMSDTKGSFVYKKLENNEVGTLAFMELEEADISGKRTGKINGQFMHERLLGENIQGLNVLLVDEAGNVYARTTTDKNGNFTFDKLPSDQNFFITTDSKYDDLKLLLYNSKDEVVAELKRKEGTPFIYRRMDGKLENALTMLENQDLTLFPTNYTNLEGQFKFQKMNGTSKPLDFVAMDEAGNVIAKGTTDNRGNFILTGLPTRDVYIFKIVGNEAGLNPNDYKLQMLSRFDQELAMIKAGEAGLFMFDRRPKQVTTFSPETVLVYFEKDKADVSGEFTAKLKPLVEQLKADPSLMLQIDGHADASYTDEHNRALSMRRMLATKQYFIRNGINSKRIKGQYYGEQKLLNNCTDAAKCTEEENKVNRRCEVKVFK